GIPTSKRMRSGIWPLGGGGSSAPSTSTSAAAQAASTSNNSDAGKYAGVWRRSAMSKNAFASSSILIQSYFAANCTRGKTMTDAIWIDRSEELESLARTLESQPEIGVDTEFLRERTFFPKLCLLQLTAAGQIWLIDTLRISSLDPLMPALTAALARKVIHSARQDLEAVYLSTKRVMSPVFDTQIAAGCIGLKPQVGYAELVKTLLDVSVPKGQTRTDWSKRPLTREQLEYAADDVSYLGDIASHLTLRLRELGREHWVEEDCRALEDKELYEPDPAQAWGRLG